MRPAHYLLFATAIVGAAVLGVMSYPPAEAAPTKAATLVGAKKCKMCHAKEATGAQHTKWAAGPHAGAYASLASEKSKAKAKELGLGDPQKEPKCLKCHVTAFPVIADMAKQTITLEEGVSCESCHGAGSEYWTKKTMDGVFAGTVEHASVGLTHPITEKLCITCHNPENPFHKEFDFKASAAKVAHPYPAGFREKAKTGAK